MSVDFKAVGLRIKQQRKKKNCTQEYLAEKLNVSVGYVSNLERGTTKISLTTLAKIADVLECDMCLFISGLSTGSELYLNRELNELIQCLSDKEKKKLFELLKVYLSE